MIQGVQVTAPKLWHFESSVVFVGDLGLCAAYAEWRIARSTQSA
jgi:hypothetical protein